MTRPRLLDRHGITWRLGSPAEVNPLLAEHHYLGPIKSGSRIIVVGEGPGQHVVAAQVWRTPTSRRLPSDGTWLELSRWCLTPAAGDYAGSRNHRFAVRLLKATGAVSTLVSYSDPSQGHTGALYRSCNWQWAPTWIRLRPPPTGNGDWKGAKRQEPKDRWVFHMRPTDPHRGSLVTDDLAAVKFWLRHAPGDQLGWAERSDYMRHFLPQPAERAA